MRIDILSLKNPHLGKWMVAFSAYAFLQDGMSSARRARRARRALRRWGDLQLPPGPPYSGLGQGVLVGGSAGAIAWKHRAHLISKLAGCVEKPAIKLIPTHQAIARAPEEAHARPILRKPTGRRAATPLSNSGRWGFGAPPPTALPRYLIRGPPGGHILYAIPSKRGRGG